MATFKKLFLTDKRERLHYKPETDRQRDDITMLSMMITIERVVPNTGQGVIFIVKFRNRVTLTKQTIL